MFKILQKGKIQTVTADPVKPAHIEREPEPGITQKRQMQHKPLAIANKPTAIARKLRSAKARSRSTITPQPLKTGVESGRTASRPTQSWSWIRSNNLSTAKYDRSTVAQPANTL